jgi:prepilin peptidase CpaA
LLLRLSYEDLRRRRLPNRLVAAYGCLCPLALLASGAPPAQWLQHGIVTAVAFLVFLALFALRAMGGGDVKLGTAVLAWAGAQQALPVLAAVSFAGLALALAGLLLNAPGIRRAMPPCKWGRRAQRALSVRRGVPYGAALAVGGLAAMRSYLP